MADISYEYVRMCVCVCVWCIHFTYVYMHGLIPHVFFAFAHAAQTSVTCASYACTV